MKKLVFFGLIFVAAFSLFAQTANKIETEYYGLKWGCSPNELKTKYPAAYYENKNKNGDELYYLDTDDSTRIFFFGNNKLYMGRIAYNDCTTEKAKALTEKVVDTYGKFDDSSKGTLRGNDCITFTKQYSSKITIDFTVVDVKNSYGSSISNIIMITYTNTILGSQISQDRINKMQDDLEI